MESTTSFLELEKICSNRVSVDASKSFLSDGSRIVFHGKNNVLFVENNVRIKKSIINFCGDNALVYLSASKQDYLLEIHANSSTAVFIGENCFINQKLTLVTSERQNIIIGGESLFSYGICMRTADPHLVYDCATRERLNPSASVLLGDHIWIGQNALLLKGTTVGSGSIIGANSVLAGKRIASNVSVAGNPARVLREGVFFSPLCVHSWLADTTEKYRSYDSDEFIFTPTEQTADLRDIDTLIKSTDSAEKKLEIVQERIATNTSHDRFAIAPPPPPDPEPIKQGFFKRMFGKK